MWMWQMWVNYLHKYLNVNVIDIVVKNQLNTNILGRYFKYPQTLFDEIAELGININNRDKYYPYLLFMSFEALLSPVDQRSSEKLLWVNEHVPISVYLF